MSIEISLADNLIAAFFSLIGFKDSVTEDDGKVLPHVKRALENTPYAGLEIRGRIWDRNWEHAVRSLGDHYVVKYVSPEPVGLMRGWISELQRQKRFLQEYFPSNLVPFDYIFVPAGKGRPEEEGQALRPSRLGSRTPSESSPKSLALGNPAPATYVVVMEKVCGRPLLEVSDTELFSNQTLVKNLLEFFEANNRLRRDHGIFINLVGGTALEILNPRYTCNLFATEKGRVVVVDTVLIPVRYEKEKVPAKYRFCSLYHFAYNLLVRPFENHFISRLKQTSSVSPVEY